MLHVLCYCKEENTPFTEPAMGLLALCSHKETVEKQSKA